MSDESAIVREFREKDAWGLCTCIDLKGCDPATIRDADRIRQYVIEVCDLIKMKRFGEPQVIHFGPNERVAGYSMTQLIETSLISAHFADASCAIYLDVFSCASYVPEDVAQFAAEFFGAKSHQLHVVERN